MTHELVTKEIKINPCITKPSYLGSEKIMIKSFGFLYICDRNS